MWRAQLTRHLKELRFLVDPRSEGSKAARAVYENHYNELKMLNPTLGILIRHQDDKSPRLMGAYRRGVQREVYLDGMSEGDILDTVWSFSCGPIQACATAQATWRLHLDTSKEFWVYLQLHADKAMLDDIVAKNYGDAIFDFVMKERPLSAKEKAVLDGFLALDDTARAEFGTGSLQAYSLRHLEKTSTVAQRAAVLAEWRMLDASTKDAFEQMFKIDEGIRYFRASIQEDMDNRRKIAGEPPSAEDDFVRQKWELLSVAEHNAFINKAANNEPLLEIERAPPFWEQ